MLRFHTQTGGVTLTAQQPVNNIVRVALQGFAAVCGGTQSLHTNGYDEALALPTERAAKIALRTQQIIAHESGATDTVDPFAGSYYVESLTAEIEQRAWALIEKVDELGGSVERDRVHQERDRGVGLRLPRALPHRAGHRRRRQQVRRGGRRGRGDPARRPGVRARAGRAPEGVQGRPRPGAGRPAASRSCARPREGDREPAARRSAQALKDRARSARSAARCATCSASTSPSSELGRRCKHSSPPHAKTPPRRRTGRLPRRIAAPAAAQASFTAAPSPDDGRRRRARTRTSRPRGLRQRPHRRAADAATCRRARGRPARRGHRLLQRDGVRELDAARRNAQRRRPSSRPHRRVAAQRRRSTTSSPAANEPARLGIGRPIGLALGTAYDEACGQRAARRRPRLDDRAADHDARPGDHLGSSSRSTAPS